MKRRSPQAQEVRSPKYRPRVVPNRKRVVNKRACRAKGDSRGFFHDLKPAAK